MRVVSWRGPFTGWSLSARPPDPTAAACRRSVLFRDAAVSIARGQFFRGRQKVLRCVRIRTSLGLLFILGRLQRDRRLVQIAARAPTGRIGQQHQTAGRDGVDPAARPDAAVVLRPLPLAGRSSPAWPSDTPAAAANLPGFRSRRIAKTRNAFLAGQQVSLARLGVDRSIDDHRTRAVLRPPPPRSVCRRTRGRRPSGRPLRNRA